MTVRTPFDGCLVIGCAEPYAIGCCGFCVGHWAKVPQPVRDHLIATFQRPMPNEDYYQALRDAREEATR